MFDFLLAVRFPINLPDRFASMQSVPFVSTFALAFLFKRKVSSQTSEPCLCWTIECQGCCGRYLMAKITSPSDVQQTSSLVDIGKYSKLKIDTNSILPFCMKLNIITEFKYMTVIGRWYEFTIFLSCAIHYIKPPISLYTMLKMWEIWGRTAQNNSSSQNNIQITLYCWWWHYYYVNCTLYYAKKPPAHGAARCEFGTQAAFNFPEGWCPSGLRHKHYRSINHYRGDRQQIT